MPIRSGKFDYPKGIVNELSSKVQTIAVEAEKHATELGNRKVMNIILLGTIVKTMNLEDINWDKIISDNVKEQFVDINRKAFEIGISLV